MIDLTSGTWRKSSYSTNDGCVEVAFVDGHVAVRDSKDRAGPVLLFTVAEWTAFVRGVAEGQLSYPQPA